MTDKMIQIHESVSEFYADIARQTTPTAAATGQIAAVHSMTRPC